MSFFVQGTAPTWVPVRFWGGVDLRGEAPGGVLETPGSSWRPTLETSYTNLGMWVIFLLFCLRASITPRDVPVCRVGSL